MATTLTDLQLTRTAADVDGLPVDKSLVLRFQMGEPGVYDEIFARYQPFAERICMRVLGNREDAQEAVQETMLRVLRGLPVFNGRYQLQAWIARIATNVSVDMVRARARRPQNGMEINDLLDARGADDLDPEEIVTRILEQERVRAVLHEIPDHHREVLLLREFEGRSHEEIAGTMGVSPAQAKALIHRAKGTFRRAWGEEHRGIAAFLPWFLIPAGLRRLSGGLNNLAARASVSPVATEATASTAEKVTAAAVAVMVAGTVGVGAIAVRHSKDIPKPSPAAAVVAPAPVQEAAVVSVAVGPPVVKHPKPKAAQPEVPVVTVPAPVETSTPEPSPVTEPSGNPSPPPVVLPPAWTFGFESAFAFAACDCPLQMKVKTSHVDRQEDGDVAFRQTLGGSGYDAGGAEAWSMTMEYEGVVVGQTGTLGYLNMYIATAAGGWYPYTTSGGSLLSATSDDQGLTTYTFTGAYQLRGTQEVVDDAMLAPETGSYQASFTFWSDGQTLICPTSSLWDDSRLRTVTREEQPWLRCDVIQGRAVNCLTAPERDDRVLAVGSPGRTSLARCGERGSGLERLGTPVGLTPPDLTRATHMLGSGAKGVSA